MMRELLFLGLLLLAVSAERYIPNSAHPDKPGYCYHKDLKLPIKMGEYERPTNIGECFELGCQEDGVIRINECGRYPSHCKIVSTDFSQEYPDCCPKLKCT